MKAAVVVAMLSFLALKYTKRSDRPQLYDEYDFVVVGSGPSGCAVANRLSEDSNIKVLLLEAGVSDLADARIQIPSMAPSLERSSVDWKYESEPQKDSHRSYPDRVSQWPRGKVLGGTSSINYHTYIRGSPHDYDSWVDHGASGWSWKDVEPFFKRAESATMETLSEGLGKTGPLKLTRSHTTPTPMTELFQRASKEINFPYVDYIDDMEGLSHTTVAVYNGIRQNAMNAYIRPILEERKDRLHVLTEALVTKILVAESDARPKAHGVQYLQDGKYFDIRAKKEVIISAGAIATPQLLMLSGIGPDEHLRKHKIPVVMNLPGVGRNLQDHVRTGLPFTAQNLKKLNETVENAELRYILDGGGPLAELQQQLIHYRTPLSGTQLSVSTRNRPVPEIQFYLIDLSRNPEPYPFMVSVNLNRPKTRGKIMLHSADPEDHPEIHHQYYENKDDLSVHIEGFRLLERFENSSSFKEILVEAVLPEVCEGADNKEIPRSDDYYRCLMLETSLSGGHQCCTAKMGSSEDPHAVVDSNLRVYGVQGLRVADASVMPHVVSVNTQATCYMIAEKVSDLIKNEWHLL